MAQVYSTLEAVFTADTTDFDAGLRRVDDAMESSRRSFGERLQDMGGGLMRFGAQIALVAAPLMALFGGGVALAADFDSAMANAGAILGMTREEAAGLRAEVLAMGSAAAAGPQAVAESYYDIVSGVQDATTHMHILDAAIRTSEAGQANLTGTTSGLIAVMNSYKFAADDVNFVSDVMTRTVGMGVMTMDELAAAIPTVTGMADAMGIEFDTLGGYMAYVTAQGLSASEASTVLRGAMSAMLNPTSNLQSAIEDLGFDTGEAMVATLGLDGALAAIRDYGDGSFAGLLTAQEALRAGLILTGEGADEFFSEFAEGIEGATDAARDIQMEALSHQINLLKSAASGAAITLGNVFVPLLVDAAQAVTPLVGRLAEWAEANPEIIRTVGLLTGGLAVLGTVLTVAGGALSLVGTALGLILSPIGLVIGAVVALGAAWTTNFMGIRDAVAPVIAAVGDGLGRLAELGGELVGAVREGDFGRVGEILRGALEDGLSWLQNAAGWVAANIVTPLAEALGSGELLAQIADGARTLGAAAMGALESALSLAARAAGWVADNIVTPLAEALAGYVASGQLVEDARSVGDAITGAIGAGLGLIAGAPAWVGENIATPMAEALGRYVASGQIVEDAFRLGRGIMRAIGAGLGLLITAPFWVLDNIIIPLAENIAGYVLSGRLVDDALALGGAIIGAIGDGLGAIGEWVGEYLIAPFASQLGPEGVAHLIAAAGALGAGIMSAIADGVGSVREWIHGALIQPIEDAFNRVKAIVERPFNFGGGGSGSIDTAIGALSGSRGFGGDEPGFADGGWTGAGSSADVAGVVHRNEYVVPEGGAMVYPTPRGLMMAGGGGRQIVVQTVVVQANNLAQLWDELQREAEKRAR